ncbi:MAG: nicotinamide riboside transporter PnuC [Congregibacter sp.]
MTPAIEGIAVGLGLLYLILAMREKRIAWVAGGAASSIFLLIFWQANLPMQALLQVYYVGIAVFAWRRWGAPESAGALHITRDSVTDHLRILALCITAVAGTLLLRDALSDGQAWLDTSTSWGAVIATWMVAQKRLDAWIYWIIIDAATAALYLEAGLIASGALYILYTALALLAWRQWRANYQRNTSPSASER